ncbi:hypothetical protein PR048_000795 [Dryococelus australis]|uniref:Uncharacterized protein n=1 Tax=Dryococelus australis TaxID=614101 RepID=A0ABQ9IG80_9NEOP|nr:hypothetical protein PR048_000795 [Dryococelus australis]
MIARSPPTKANRVQSPAGSLDFRKWESCRTMPLVGGFFRGSSISPAPSFQRRSIFTSITRFGCQDLAPLRACEARMIYRRARAINCNRRRGKVSQRNVYKARLLCLSACLSRAWVSGVFETSEERSGLLTSFLSAKLGWSGRLIEQRVGAPSRGVVEWMSFSDRRLARREGRGERSDQQEENLRLRTSEHAGMKGRGKWQIPEKIHRPAVSPGTIPTCENPGVTRSEIEPGLSWWEASSLTATVGPVTHNINDKRDSREQPKRCRREVNARRRCGREARESARRKFVEKTEADGERDGGGGLKRGVRLAIGLDCEQRRGSQTWNKEKGGTWGGGRRARRGGEIIKNAPRIHTTRCCGPGNHRLQGQEFDQVYFRPRMNFVKIPKYIALLGGSLLFRIPQESGRGAQKLKQIKTAAHNVFACKLCFHFIAKREAAKPTVPYGIEKMLACLGRLTFAATEVCLTSSTPHVHWVGACWSASMGAAGPLPPTKLKTPFPSLVRLLDHVTPASQSRTTRVPFQDFWISTEHLHLVVRLCDSGSVVSSCPFHPNSVVERFGRLFNIEVLRSVWSSAGMEGRRKLKIPEKTRRHSGITRHDSHTQKTNPTGNRTRLAFVEASSLTTTPPLPLRPNELRMSSNGSRIFFSTLCCGFAAP